MATGIDQVNQAVAEMEKVTQQTAASADESASASEEMNTHAQQMRETASTLLRVIGEGSGNFAEDEQARRAPPFHMRTAIQTGRSKLLTSDQVIGKDAFCVTPVMDLQPKLVHPTVRV